jgi:acyl-CoA synthetase (AMP-forming)/AMP-acid ligase II
MAEHPTFHERDLSAVRGGTLVEALPLDRRPRKGDQALSPLGMTETGGPHTGVDDTEAPIPDRLATFGRPLPGMEHRVVDPETGNELARTDDGELLVRGVFLMQELYKQERHDTFTSDGWYPTGDLGSFDCDGYLSFTGRRTAMIKSGGSNISPAEVEAVLTELPGVVSAYVFGIPAGDRGQDVAAVVVHSEGGEAPDAAELRTLARQRLSAYKVPRHFRSLAEREVPLLATGKVDLARLATLFAEG